MHVVWAACTACWCAGTDLLLILLLLWTLTLLVGASTLLLHACFRSPANSFIILLETRDAARNMHCACTDMGGLQATAVSQADTVLITRPTVCQLSSQQTNDHTGLICAQGSVLQAKLQTCYKI